MTFNLLHRYYTSVAPNRQVLELCGAAAADTPYTREVDTDLTAIVNGYARPEYLPLVWEALQYQTRAPRETWIVQNEPGARSAVPRSFLDQVRGNHRTVVFDAGLNLGCWFRFFLAALYCRTRWVALFDDDTLPGREAIAAALQDMERRPGVYGGRGITFKHDSDGARFWNHDVSGWPAGTPHATEVDFVGQMWVLETRWLRELFRHLPERLFQSAEPGRECGEDMYLSFVAQRCGIPTLVYAHGAYCSARWSSVQAYEMGFHANAMNSTGGLAGGDDYLRDFIVRGWRLLRYR